jgi:hypothetical protein
MGNDICATIRGKGIAHYYRSQCRAKSRNAGRNAQKTLKLGGASRWAIAAYLLKIRGKLVRDLAGICVQGQDFQLPTGRPTVAIVLLDINLNLSAVGVGSIFDIPIKPCVKGEAIRQVQADVPGGTGMNTDNQTKRIIRAKVKVSIGWGNQPVLSRIPET